MVYYGCLLSVHKVNTHAHMHLGLALAAAGQEMAAHSMFAHALLLNPLHADAVQMHASMHVHTCACAHARARCLSRALLPVRSLSHFLPHACAHYTARMQPASLPACTCVIVCPFLAASTSLYCKSISHYNAYQPR